MARVVIVKSIGNHSKIFENTFYASPFHWCPGSVENKVALTRQTDQYKLGIWFAGYLASVLGNIFCLTIILVQLFYPFLHPGHVVITILAICACTLPLIFNTFIYFNASQIVSLYETLFTLDRKLTDEYIHSSERKELESWGMFATVFQLVTAMCLASSLAASMIALFFQFSPLVWVLENILTPIDHIVLRVALAPFLSIGFVHLWSPVLFLAYMSIGYVCFIERWLQVIKPEDINQLIQFNEFKKTKIMLMRNPMIALKVYRKVRVLNDFVNETFACKLFVTPPIIGIPGLMAILASFVSVKMRKMIPMPSYAAFPLLIMVVFILQSVGIHAASLVHTQSKSFVERGKMLRRSGPHYKRFLKSCQIMKINVGPFTSFQRETALSYLQVMTSYTMSLILAVKIHP